MKARYILLKDTPELKKGAVLEEICDDGNQGFRLADRSLLRFPDQEGCSYSRMTVIDQPEWFEEVSLLYLTKKQMEKVKKLLG